MKPVFAFLLSACSVAHASPDLVNCLYPNGNAIPTRICEGLRSIELREREEAAERDQRHRDVMKAADKQRADSRALEAARSAQAQEVRQGRQAESDAERAASDLQQAERTALIERKHAEQAAVNRELAEAASKEQAAAEAREERAFARQRAFLKQKRAECGVDFQTPRLGMTLARARQCVGTLRLRSEAASFGDVTSIYSVGPYYLTTVNGRIVSWVGP